MEQTMFELGEYEAPYSCHSSSCITQFELEWYTHLITTALENNDAVVEVDAPETFIDIFVTVENDTDEIENECIYFDLNMVHVEDVADGLRVTLFEEEDWNPIRPEQTPLDEYDSFYHVLADMFGGEPDEYQLDESYWSTECTKLQLGYWELYKDGKIEEDELRDFTDHGPTHFELLYEPGEIETATFEELEEAMND